VDTDGDGDDEVEGYKGEVLKSEEDEDEEELQEATGPQQSPESSPLPQPSADGGGGGGGGAGEGGRPGPHGSRLLGDPLLQPLLARLSGLLQCQLPGREEPGVLRGEVPDAAGDVGHVLRAHSGDATGGGRSTQTSEWVQSTPAHGVSSIWLQSHSLDLWQALVSLESSLQKELQVAAVDPSTPEYQPYQGMLSQLSAMQRALEQWQAAASAALREHKSKVPRQLGRLPVQQDQHRDVLGSSAGRYMGCADVGTESLGPEAFLLDIPTSCYLPPAPSTARGLSDAAPGTNDR
jgi:hypothetical protein